MNALIKVGAAVMNLRAKVIKAVTPIVVFKGILIATQGFVISASTLIIARLRNGGVSISSVTPDFT